MDIKFQKTEKNVTRLSFFYRNGTLKQLFHLNGSLNRRSSVITSSSCAQHNNIYLSTDLLRVRWGGVGPIGLLDERMGGGVFSDPGGVEPRDAEDGGRLTLIDE